MPRYARTRDRPSLAAATAVASSTSHNQPHRPPSSYDRRRLCQSPSTGVGPPPPTNSPNRPTPRHGSRPRTNGAISHGVCCQPPLSPTLRTTAPSSQPTSLIGYEMGNGPAARSGSRTSTRGTWVSTSRGGGVGLAAPALCLRGSRRRRRTGEQNGRVRPSSCPLPMLAQ
ncbi:hypothetical protein GALMADRAFT_141667 [Galerina marginata CBS 339.88]|uniref:Uncharacterized protein n=1 Tax=Galerina marginata (strain CBS 339.88) TaxID=685588 RepID=A0A067SV19_GALM3|nr:hypothetical protein GALMADRAFT_141667 [Galerina marginata CBS 339.88]